MTRHLVEIEVIERSGLAAVILSYAESYIGRTYPNTVGSAYRGASVAVTCWRTVQDRHGFRTWEEALAFAAERRSAMREHPEPVAF